MRGDPPGTGDHRGGEEKTAEGSAVWDWRDTDGMRGTIKTSRNKTEIGITS